MNNVSRRTFLELTAAACAAIALPRPAGGRYHSLSEAAAKSRLAVKVDKPNVFEQMFDFDPNKTYIRVYEPGTKSLILPLYEAGREVKCMNYDRKPMNEKQFLDYICGLEDNM